MTAPVTWLLCYLVGSIPIGVWLGKIRNIDILEHGSGNIGATNVARTLGKKAGLLTLLADCSKGFLAVWGASMVLEKQEQVALAGLLVFLGHLFSIFLKFKGGKGVATGLGVFLYLLPVAAVIAIGVFGVSFMVSKYVSIGSMTSAVFIPIFGYFYQSPLPYVLLAAVMGLLVIIKHYSNIQRLLAGTESTFLRK